MLLEKISTCCQPTLDELESSNVAISAKPGTPLASLVNTSYNVKEDIKGEEISSPTSNVINGANVLGGHSEHTLAMDEITELASSTVQLTLNHARNVFLPLVKEIVQSVTDTVGSSVDEQFKIGVVMHYDPTLYSNSILLDMVERFAEHFEAKPIIRPGMYPELSGEEIKELLMTGIGRLDEEIETWVKDLEPDYLTTHYRSIFSNGQLVETPCPFVQFLVARKFLDEVPDGTGVDLQTFNSITTELMAIAGKAIHYRNVNDVNRKRLRQVIKYLPKKPDPKDPIIVYAETYKAWLKDGGTPEIMMGLIVSRDQTRDYDALLERGEKYQADYEKAKRLANLGLSANKVRVFTRTISAVVGKIIEEGDKTFIHNREELYGRLNKALDDMVLSPDTDLKIFVRELVHRVFYSHTDSFRIVKSVDSICASNPEYSPREAATLAVIDVVVDWVDSQITAGS